MKEKKTISLKVSETVFQEIERRKSIMQVSRTEAVVMSILNSKFIGIEEGHQLVAQLHKIDCVLTSGRMRAEETAMIKEACDGIWQLLSSITEKIQQETEE